MPISVAFVGIGKIARDQHLPAVAADPRWRRLRPEAASCLKPARDDSGECKVLARVAKANGLTLFATWHSLEAAGVQAAKVFLAKNPLKSLKVTLSPESGPRHIASNLPGSPRDPVRPRPRPQGAHETIPPFQQLHRSALK